MIHHPDPLLLFKQVDRGLPALWHENLRKSEWVSARWPAMIHWISRKSAICPIYESFHLGLSFRYHYLITILCHSYAKKKKERKKNLSENHRSIFRVFDGILAVACGLWPISVLQMLQNAAWIMQRNVFLINNLLRVCKIKWREEVLNVNQQKDWDLRGSVGSYTTGN